MKSLLPLHVIAAVLFIVTPLRASDFKRTIRFEMFDPKTNEKIYWGDEDQSRQGNRIEKNTVFYNEKKQLVQVETIAFDIKENIPQHYTLSNKQMGEEVDLKVVGSKIHIKYTSKTGEAAKVKSDQKWEPDMYLGKMLNEQIIARVKDLKAGKKISFKLYVPMYQDYYSFRLRVLKPGQSDIPTEANEFVVRLEPDLWLVRQIVEELDFFYSDTEEPRLLRYYGPSTVDIKGVKNKIVLVRFK